MKVDPDDVEPGQLRGALQDGAKNLPDKSYQDAGWTSASSLMRAHKERAAPVINHLLRRGEVCNIVAPSKAGKSWIVYWMLFSLTSGRPWMREDWTMEPGTALLIDNELAPSLLADRLRTVMKEMDLPQKAADRIHVMTLKGELDDSMSFEGGIDRAIAMAVSAKAHVRPSIIVLDALYRFLPKGCSENDNADMTQLYNKLDRLAVSMNAAVVIVHHSSKGNQADKSATDVGSGAGAISRAADTHIVIREHQVEGCFTIEARCRSWKPPEPVVAEWEHPRWKPRPELDPADLKRPGRPQSSADPAAPAPRPEHELDDAAFAALLEADQRMSATQLIERMRFRLGYSRTAGRACLDSIIGRHRLTALRQEDGELDLGTFCVETINGGFKFWVKEKP